MAEERAGQRAESLTETDEPESGLSANPKTERQSNDQKKEVYSDRSENGKPDQELVLQAKPFEQLSLPELYEILKARAAIFILEQQINYQDLDDIDYRALHCFYRKKGKVVAYLRAFADHQPGSIRIGRVLTLEHGQGMGRKLFGESLKAIESRWHPDRLVMDAQQYAIGFYERFGFETTTEPFIEEGILHVGMEKKRKGKSIISHEIPQFPEKS